MKKIKIMYLILILGLAMPSCTNLVEEPFNDLTSDIYYQDKNSIMAAVTRPYEHGHWCGWDGDRWYLSELSADQFIWAQKGKHGYDDGNWVRLHGHAWTSQEGSVNGGWVGPYQGIAQCNLIIQDLGKLDFPKFGLTDVTKAAYIAELRTLRAWFYLFLIDYYRTVPIITLPQEVKTNSTAVEVYAFIEKELKESLPGLPKNGKVGRWDQAGAAALLVRLYLNGKAWTGTDRFSDCATYADGIIKGTYGTYSIDPDYRGPFRSGINGYRSAENIFEFPHAKDIYNFGWMYDAMMHYQLKFTLDNNWGGWNGISLSPSRDLDGSLLTYKLGTPYENYATGDQRKKPFVTTGKGVQYEGFFLIGQQYEYNKAQGYGLDSTKKVLGVEEYNGRPLVFVDQVGRFSEKPGGRWSEGSHIVTGEENTGVRLLKFPWLPMSQGLFQFNSATEVRLAEIYYALAECKFRSGDVDGAALLMDAVRKRNFSDASWAANSYVNHPANLTADEFVKDLGREFIGERHRRTDLVRWGRFGEAWWDKSADTADKTVYPIPARALNANPLLKPNGY